MSKQAPAKENKRFENTKTARRVLEWLQDAGYDIKSSRFYQDVADGKLAKDEHGFFTPGRVKKYAADHLVKVGAESPENEELSSLACQKAEEELERLRIANRRDRRKEAAEQGQLVPRDDFERELAGRIVVLDSGVRTVNSTKAREYIALVGGNPAREDELIAALDANWGDLLNNYASLDEWAVVVLPDPDADSHDGRSV